MKLFFLFFLFVVELACANPKSVFEIQTFNTDSMDVVAQKNRINRFFDNKIDWNRGKLYVFVDKDEISRLVVFLEGDSVELYQIPSARVSRWMNPSGYLEQMQNLKKMVKKHRCQQKIEIEKTLGVELLSMDLDSYPMVRAKEQNSYSFYRYKYVPSYNKAFYCGYVKREGQSRYFRFTDFRQEGAELQYPLNKFVAIFEKLEQYPFTVELEGCK
ncbi:MAG: hypothetical protein IK012_04510 [Fibrobacter sp.]|uniref:hypothetical protein n=1 Tax=Fibrobacter sp. TaxID=35828 RepID=UPI0025BF5629|nr:hypothetical protein [Fibrobacter sp.]MBR4784500.1 hypothetical protein [Fibrobacter sp.]